MSRNSILDSWFCRAAGFLVGSSLALNAWAGDTAVAVGNASVTVTGAGTSISFPVTRTGDLSYDAYLSFQTQDNTAAAGTDYAASRGSWLLPKGVASLNIPVAVNGKNAAAADKQFSLNMLAISTAAPDFALQSPQTFAAGPNPYVIAAADVNGDGKPDLIVADYDSGSVGVLINTTAPGALTPSFAAQQVFTVGSTTFAVAVADMNGDGKPDLIATDQNDGVVYVLVNTTAAGATIASYAAAQSFALQSGNAGMATVADLNGDGKPDLVVGGNTNAVTVFINNTATDSPTVNLIRQTVAVGGNVSTMYVATADLNGDGKPDLVVTDGTQNTVSVLLNTSAVGSQSPSFSAPLVMSTGTAPAMCAAADLNGDGNPDLMVANNQGGSVSVFVNTTPAGASTPSFAAQQTFTVGANPRSVVAADVDGDGRPDLVVGYDGTTTNGISVLINTAEPGAASAGFAAQQVFGTTTSSYFVATADIDGDGRQDIIARSGDNTMVFLNATTPGVAPAGVASLSPASLAFGSQPVGVTSAAQSVTLTNTGNATLNLGDIAATGPYAETNTCGASVAVNGTCTITVTFTPTAQGSLTGSITLTDDALNSPQSIVLSGTGLQATAALSPVSLAFGNLGVGVTSAAQTVTLTNNGNIALSISSIAATGPYAETNTCGASVAPGAQCTISVTFTPAAEGSQAGSLTITDNAGDSPETIALSGNGMQATASLSVASLTFGNQGVGTTSVVQPVTLTNSGNLVLNLSSIVASAPYAVTNNCGATLAAGAQCILSVTFAPTAIGAQNGSLTITDDAGNSPQTVSLSGTGMGAVVALAPASLTFASQAIGSTSAAQPVTLTNNGNATLNLSSIVASGPYAETNTCGTSLAAGTNCTISVTYTPTTAGTQSGTLTITDDAGNSPQTVSLSGSGTGPVVGFSPASLVFATQQLNTTSAAQTVTLTNSGNAALNLSSISASGAFAQTNTCGTSLAPGGQCTISVTFTPTVAGAQNSSLVITDNAGDSPETIALSGTGGQAIASLSVTSLAFGNQISGTTSAVQSVTLTNTGNLVLNLSNVAASGPFAQTNTCGTSVAAGASCTVSVTFTPTATGAQTGSIVLTDNAADSPQTVSLSGTGTAGVPSVSLSMTSWNFGNDPLLGNISAEVTLTNSGSAALSVTSIATSGAPFAQTNNCGSSVAVGASCTILVSFEPTVPGAQSGTLTITDNAADSPQTVSLSGTGLGPAVSLSQTSAAWLSRTIDTTSATRTITLTNTGNETLAGPLSVTLTGTNPGQFAEVPTCGITLAVNASCTVTLTFTPTSDGPKSGILKFTDSAIDSPQEVTLSASGLVAGASISPTSLSFSTVVGNTSAAKTVTLTNSGGDGGELFNISVGLSGGSASLFTISSNSCNGATIASGASCTVGVEFKPAATGSVSTALKFSYWGTVHNGTSQSITVTGSGTSGGGGGGGGGGGCNVKPPNQCP